MDNSHHLPPELWNLIFEEFTKLYTIQVAEGRGKPTYILDLLKCRILSNNFNGLIKSNDDIKYNLLLIHGNRLRRARLAQFVWLCNAGENEFYFGYSDFPRIKVIKWAINKFNITYEDIERTTILIDICKKGHLSILKFLMDTFGLANDKKFPEGYATSQSKHR